MLVPTLINRKTYLGEEKEFGGDAGMKRADISHREWIYRQAFHLGRHVLGYEVQQVRAAIDWFADSATDPVISVGGYGEGALVALAAAAVDTRIGTTLAGGYLGGVTASWEQPIFRNLFGFEKEFGVSGLVALLGHRQLAVHLVPGPVFTSSKGKLNGEWDWEPVEKLFRAPDSVGKEHPVRWMVDVNPSLQVRSLFNFVSGTETFREDTRFNVWLDEGDPDGIADLRESFSPDARHERLFRQMEGHVQRLIREADSVREEWFLYQAEPALRPGRWSTEKDHPALDPSRFIEQASEYREIFARDAMGEFDEAVLPATPRSRLVAETDSWTAWDVVLDVYPELFAWGVLVMPKDIAPGERRPVVVCQHGRNGLPRDCIDGDKSAYNNFAARLAERGFITFSPHNLYRGEDRYRWLDRKANAIGGTLFSFIIPSHRQILDWLKTQPQVDGERIAFYGLSYGGETAMRVPALLEDYVAVICSGDFNQWTRKVAATDYPRGFLRSIEWEMPFWNLGQTFDYAEMAYLIFPRPFLVERGYHDLVAIDPWVAHEYAKVRRHYAQFGLAGSTGIEWFQGGHSIHGEESFDFLHRHLGWPRIEYDVRSGRRGRKIY